MNIQNADVLIETKTFLKRQNKDIQKQTNKMLLHDIPTQAES